jgi:DNA modification methylase
VVQLLQGDCLDRMAEIAAGSIDAIIADPPYGSTQCAWDQRIDLPRFWDHARRLISPGSAVVMFADMRYAVDLIASNPKWFRYDLIWDKVAPVGFLDANRRPLRSHELILVFGPKLPRYRSTGNLIILMHITTTMGRVSRSRSSEKATPTANIGANSTRLRSPSP